MMHFILFCCCLVASSVHAATRVSHTELAEKVVSLSSVYRTVGKEETIIQMKELRKYLGNKVIFSIVQVTDKEAGKLLYHPTPFVTGHYVQVATDAENRHVGRDLIEKAQKTEPGKLFWVEYSQKSAFDERLLRQMCCARVDNSMICGSIPSAGKLPG
jgi:hypothetical protein